MCYLNTEENNTFNFSSSLQKKIKTGTIFCKGLFSSEKIETGIIFCKGLFSPVQVEIGIIYCEILFSKFLKIFPLLISHIIAIILAIMLVHKFNDFFIYYFNLPLDILWFRLYFRFSMFGFYLPLSVLIKCKYMQCMHGSIINHSLLTNNIYHNFTLQKLFLVLSFGFLGFFMSDLILGTTTVRYNGFIVMYTYHEQFYAQHKYRFIRTWIDTNRKFEIEGLCNTTGFPFATTIGSLNSYIDLQSVNVEMASAPNYAMRQNLSSLASHHMTKVQGYSSVVGWIPDIVNKGAYLVITDPQGNSKFSRGTFISYSGQAAMLGFTVKLPAFLPSTANIPFVHNGINYESCYYMPRTLTREDAT